MPIITLPDGNKKRYNYSISSLEIANDISLKLAKICVAGVINGKTIDLSDTIEQDVNLSIITIKDEEGIKIIRRSCLHLLGNAIKKLWPSAKLAIKSITEKGFYYDIQLDYLLTTKDVCLIENYMYELINQKSSFIKTNVNFEQAKNIFLNRGETYKIKLLEKNFDKENYLFLYSYQEHIDLCHGPHVPNINFCRHFKLQNISGSYWNENNKNITLQRICGTAWSNKEQLQEYISHLQELEKRDHRKIGKQLDLYHLQEIAPGMIFWHNNGLIIFRTLENFIRIKLKEYQYQEVKGPILTDIKLWEKTGHLENYAEHIFTTASENRKYCIKPMNCLGHVLIFNQSLKSYRDLPLRIAEFGNCHRNEPSGALHGLMRVRSFTQDDAHIFCTKKQVYHEVNNCIKMIFDIYKTFGFKKILVKLSTRPNKRIGEDQTWDHAEQSLISVLTKNNISFELQKGEGAFYGPKIEFILFDSLNRSWQCGTIQLDFYLPHRMNTFYINEKNERVAPVMIHRAILGSIERFIGILTEEYIGHYPIWLSPIQIVLMNITEKQLKYILKIEKEFLDANIRTKVDIRNEKISFKIRENSLQKIPYLVICGNHEVEIEKISVRTSRGKNLGKFNINEFIKKVQQEIFNYRLNNLEE